MLWHRKGRMVRLAAMDSSAPSPLDAATRRLERALETLEAVIARRFDALAAERGRLTSALAAAEAGRAGLATLNQEAAGRLDQTISRLRALLDAGEAA
jgi:hypothetical protein